MDMHKGFVLSNQIYHVWYLYAINAESYNWNHKTVVRKTERDILKLKVEHNIGSCHLIIYEENSHENQVGNGS